MDDTRAFDHQLGDVVWMMWNGFYADFSLLQVFEALSKETLEPARSIFQGLFADLQKGTGFEAAFSKLRKSVPSRPLGEVLDVILEKQKSGGNLGTMLRPFEKKFIEQFGSDPGLYPFMRTLAEQIGAPLPERAK